MSLGSPLKKLRSPVHHYVSWAYYAVQFWICVSFEARVNLCVEEERRTWNQIICLSSVVVPSIARLVALREMELKQRRPTKPIWESKRPKVVCSEIPVWGSIIYELILCFLIAALGGTYSKINSEIKMFPCENFVPSLAQSQTPSTRPDPDCL